MSVTIIECCERWDKDVARVPRKRGPSGFHTYHWADYYPKAKKVVFGGDWEKIPDMKVDHEPTEKEIYDYIENWLDENF